MLKIIPGTLPNSHLHKLLLGAIGPRPIAFASTMDADGKPNLAPFSFFNVFGVNPVTIIFSPSRRGRDNTLKDTYENIRAIPEVVINAVTYEMINRVNLASSDFPKGEDEFIKAGFTKLKSEKVRPFRVGESPVQMECVVRDVIETGQGGGAANLVICEPVLMHVNEEVMADDGLVDQQKIRLVGRMGRDWYVKAFGDGLFNVEKPSAKPGIGIDGLPDKIKYSKFLSGEDLGRFGNLSDLPVKQELDDLSELPEIRSILAGVVDREMELTMVAKRYLEENEVRDALKVLMLIR